MFDATTPTSELEAVNIMLSLISEGAVPSLADAAATNPDVQAAIILLRTVTRGIATQGWTFNTNNGETLTRDGGTGHVALPSPRIRSRIDRTAPSMWNVRATIRYDGSVAKFWDTRNNTFVWPTDLVCNSVLLFPFEQLPEAMRQYITIVAARQFQESHGGGVTASKFTEDDEYRAKAGLEDYELEDSNANFLDDSPDVSDAWAIR